MVVQSSPLNDLKFQPFSWNQATITKYTNVETMKKPQFLPVGLRKSNSANGFRSVGYADSKSTASTPKGVGSTSNLRSGPTPPRNMNNTVRSSPDR